MIEGVTVANLTTLSATPEPIGPLFFCNFIFGSNGTGKTTIRRVIANTTLYPNWKLVGRRDTELETLVYNWDIVERHFSQSTHLKNACTLRKKNVNALPKIGVVKDEIEKQKNKIGHLGRKSNGNGDSGEKVRKLADTARI